MLLLGTAAYEFAQGLPFAVDNLLFFSRIFVPAADEPTAEEQSGKRQKKKNNKAQTAAKPLYYSYHLEDEAIAEVRLGPNSRPT